MNNAENQATLMERIQTCCKRLRIPAVETTVRSLLDNPENLTRSPLEWMAESLEAESDRRDSNALDRRMKGAHLRYSSADSSKIIYDEKRHLDRGMVSTLMTCEWIRNHQNCLVTGKVGTGKTYLAECLAISACRAGFSARVARVPLLLQEVANSHDIGGEYRVQLRALKKVDLLILDDWGLGPLNAISRGDLLEIVEARHEMASTIVTSVLPISAWAGWIGDVTYSDAILDRLTANAVRIDLKGESLRMREPPTPNGQAQG